MEEQVEMQDRHTRGGRSWNAFVIFFSALGGFLFGYDTGVISGAIPFLKDDLLSSTSAETEAFVIGVVVSAAIWTAAMGAAGGGRLGDVMGRKLAMAAADTFFIAGSLCMACAQSTTTLIAGRLLVGFGIGVASVLAPVFIAECSHASVRAGLIAANVLMITGGQLVSYMVNYGFSGVPGTWRWMLGVAALPAAVQLIGLFFMPESPRWLYSKGRIAESQSAVQQLFPAHLRHSVIDSMQQELQAQEPIPKASLTSMISSPIVRAQLHVGVVLLVLQQLCGINTVMYFTPVILQLAGFRDKRQALLWACLPASVNAAGTIVGMKLIDRAGRRKLLLWSTAGTALTLCALMATFWASERASPPVVPPLAAFDSPCPYDTATCLSCLHHGCIFCLRESPPPEDGGGLCSADVASCASETNDSGSQNEVFENGCPTPYSTQLLLALMAYLAAFSVGMGPVPWAVAAEIFDMPVRGFATGLAGTASWLTNGIVSQTFLMMVHALNPSGTFLVYACIATVGYMWVLRFVPETQGLALGEVQQLFAMQVVGRHASRSVSGERVPLRAREHVNSEQRLAVDARASPSGVQEIM